MKEMRAGAFMLLTFRKFTSAIAIAAILFTSFPATAAETRAKNSAIPQNLRALHALNRLTFGPRPGDVARVNAMGVDKWIEAQLNPAGIEDAAVEARVSRFSTLKMDTKEMVANFPPPQVLRAVAEGRIPMPRDPKVRAIYETQLAAYQARQQNKGKGQQNGAPGAAGDDARMMEEPQDPAARRERREERMYAEVQAETLMSKPGTERFDAIMKMSPTERVQLVQGLRPEDRQRLVQGMTEEQRNSLQAMGNPQAVIIGELVQNKLLRAIYSERQLQEVMTDFWFNHFNVFIGKGADRVLTTSYERDVIRANALGNFKNLLHATAKHPAMLFYLDNFQSVGPKSQAGVFSGKRAERANQQPRDQNGRFMRNNQQPGATMERRGRNQQSRQQPANNSGHMQEESMMAADPELPKPAKRGLNENYARELMELHTLGVDGGYNQADIVEVAKVFTGWTVRAPRFGGEFEFNSRIHEPGEKKVLGQTIQEDGMNEGKRVLDALARHPSTAKFISRKLAMRFVADDPPASLVEKMAATFTKTDGDIKSVLRTLFKSEEFWSQQAYRAKVKTPLEFVVSALRVTGAEVQNALPLGQTLQAMGMPMFGMQPPTGYSTKAEAWVNSGALLNRMNFALALASGKTRGMNAEKAALRASYAANKEPQNVEQALSWLSQQLLAGDVSEQTKDVVRKQVVTPAADARAMTEEGQKANLPLIAGLLLGSPEFQRR